MEIPVLLIFFKLIKVKLFFNTDSRFLSFLTLHTLDTSIFTRYYILDKSIFNSGTMLSLWLWRPNYEFMTRFIQVVSYDMIKTFDFFL